MIDPSISKDDKEIHLLKEVNLHILRHKNTTLLTNQCIDTTTVSKRLGHARVSTTMDIYSHKLRNTNLEASDKLEALFSKNKLYSKNHV